MDEMSIISREAAAAVEVLAKGGVILYPTDTVWGIGCDATRADAVARIFSIKQRSEAKALITLVDSLAMLERYVDEVPEVAYQLIDVAVDPLTIVYDHAHALAPNLLADDGSVGIRVTSDPFCRSLLKKFRRPLVSTSANISGMPTPQSFREIAPEIINAVDYVVDFRRDEVSSRKPSGVIKLSADGQFKILR